MKTLRILAICATLAAATGASALNLEAIDAAVYRGDLAALLALHKTATDEASPYARAYLDYRIGIGAWVADDRDLARTSLKRAARNLEDALDASPEDVEALALLSNTYGVLIGMTPLKGAFLGPKADSLVAEALRLAPDNPRARLVQGISRLQTPAMFGGDKTEALAWFDKAVAAFEAAPGAPGAPGWGHAESYVWRAKAYLALERDEEADADLARALALRPDYAWAQALASGAARK